MPEAFTQLLQPSVSFKSLLASIPANFSAHPGEPEDYQASIADTFDWRLYRKGLALYRSQNTLQLLKISGNLPQATEQWPARKKLPVFAWDLPVASGLRLALAPIIEMRALLPKATTRNTRRAIDIRNDDDKIVLRLTLETLRLPKAGKGSRQTFGILSFAPLRGYEAECKIVREALSAGCLFETEPAGDWLTTILQREGHQPGAYSAKITLQLDERESTLEAALRIHRHSLGVIRANEQGTIDDIDSEFLHDFRVALRRSRAALSQFKGAFSEADTTCFKETLGNIQRMTNNVRDLDVYLLERSAYMEQVSEALRPGLALFFKRLAAERKRAFVRMKKALQSKAYRDSMNGWEHFIDGSAGGGGTHAAMPIKPLAQKWIWKRYRKIVQDGLLINESSPDAALHTLRIACKKLRYSMEFFTSLFPPEAIETEVKRLRKLQNVLGEFNDLCVQQDTLYSYLNKLSEANRKNLQQAAAIGFLTARLHQNQVAVRASFASAFEDFASAQTEQSFAPLFHP